ncbi:MAG: phosphoenolpyruvate--protein phosphotransferase, partial [Bacillota bacterium]
LLPFLLGAGLDEFSMSAVSIPKVKNAIRSLNYQEVKEITSKVLTLSTTEEIEEFLNQIINEKIRI